MGRRRAGFTLVEVLVVMIILGLLSGIALLKYLDMRATAKTAALAADFRAVTVAALNYYADNNEWPAESGPGQVPNGLRGYLPGGLTETLERPDYVLDYENIALGETPLIGVSVRATDTRLMGKFVATFGDRSPFFMNGDKLTYLIAGPGGVF